MAEAIYDVVAVGNAIVDVLAKKDDDFLAEHDIPKGVMSLIDEQRAEELFSLMGKDSVKCSGGSAANTTAGLASLGSKPAFIGKVKNDELGKVFGDDISSLGVHFETPFSEEGPSTARCMVMVTPDAERTMNTYLGASVRLGPEDIERELIEKAKVVYLEGYLWDEEKAKEAMMKAGTIAHSANRKVSLTLSDPFCVDRHRGEFLGLVENIVDILFCNDAEICSLYKTESVDEAVEKVRKECELTVITCGKDGAIVATKDNVLKVKTEEVENLVDTTGAGDQFAAGFLAGYTSGKDLETCAKMGCITAAEIISHYGARPEVSLAELIKEKLG